ncbi:hypothetical protein [[Scytonema hofmanni] UTEX B 1581]|nr:hypothetical protein [[Scytonema hofmanni] UTEX B 1581]
MSSKLRSLRNSDRYELVTASVHYGSDKINRTVLDANLHHHGQSG